jgi:DNA polymerase-1
MILQVHDELVFEVAPAEFDAHAEMLRREMTEAMTLSVPLVVDVGRGRNWREAH